MMVEWLNEPIAVEAQSLVDGGRRPMAFTWRGTRYVVMAWGREEPKTWNEESFHCYMVQTPGPETWQLCCQVEQGTWVVRRRWPRPPMAV